MPTYASVPLLPADPESNLSTTLALVLIIVSIVVPAFLIFVFCNSHSVSPPQRSLAANQEIRDAFGYEPGSSNSDF